MTNYTQLKKSLIIVNKMTDLTLDGGGEGRLRLKEGAHSCTYSWVEVLKATLLSPQRTTHLYQMTTEAKGHNGRFVPVPKWVLIVNLT